MEYIAHECIDFFITTIPFEKTQSTAMFAIVTRELVFSEQNITWTALQKIHRATNSGSRVHRFPLSEQHRESMYNPL